MVQTRRSRPAGSEGVALPALIVGVAAGVVWYVATRPLLGSAQGPNVTDVLLAVSVACNAALAYTVVRLSRRGQAGGGR